MVGVGAMSGRIRIGIGLAALVLLFAYKLAFSDLILGRGDTFAFFYPLWAARDAALIQGQLPLWTGDVFMGAPILADPQFGTLYPPNWLTITLAPPDAIRVSVLLHLFWALLGAYLLARRVVLLPVIPSMMAGVLFAFGGYIGAHIEQINQLQGLAWLPWACWVYSLALTRPGRWLPVLAMIFALQVFSGHTQTVFITGVGLAIYGVIAAPPKQRLKAPLWLGIAAGIAAVLALGQLWPTLELTGLSNRGGGFNPQQAMAFSWTPWLAGRGLLPSYDAQVFGEYIAYVGVIGLGLALIGAGSADRRRWPWIALALVGIVLALGLYTPIYWLLAQLPGFNLFRVPARWLALFALSAAMLAGIGVQALIVSRVRWPVIIGTLITLILIAASTVFADRAANEVDGSAIPTITTILAWASALIVLIALLFGIPRRALSLFALGVVIVELWFAAQTLPYNDLVDRAAYHDPRLSVYHLQALQDDPPHGRMLSISQIPFDPGDRAGLVARYSALGMSERATRTALTAAKLKEVIAPNLSMIWGIPSLDGAGGGLIPTGYYTQFTALLLPEGTPRTLDGRLREVLSGCRGACIPDRRWLNLTDTRYLIVDKTADLWEQGFAYDLTFSVPSGTPIPLRPAFEATVVSILHTGEAEFLIDDSACVLPEPDAGISVCNRGGTTAIGEFQMTDLYFAFPMTPQMLIAIADPPITIHAVTLIDGRTGDFQQIPLADWRLSLSSDVKIYENPQAFGRAFTRYDAEFVPDTWDGTEEALRRMRDPNFDPAQTVILHTDTPIGLGLLPSGRDPVIRWRHYDSTRLELDVFSDHEGILVLNEAYYPGWTATRNGESVEIIRANVMFRAVLLETGSNQITLEYRPPWLIPTLLIGIIGWGILGAWVAYNTLSSVVRSSNK
jgi:hypothetical protein